MGLGFGLRMLVGQPRIATVAVLVLTLIPWFLHHQLVLEYGVVVGRAAYIGPGIVALTVTGALFLGGWARLLVAFIPAAAFVISWYVTIPMVSDILPPGNLILYDNMRTIWLTIWTAGATMFLLAYALLTSGAKSTV